jgi:hypothetical protein
MSTLDDIKRSDEMNDDYDEMSQSSHLPCMQGEIFAVQVGKEVQKSPPATSLLPLQDIKQYFLAVLSENSRAIDVLCVKRWSVIKISHTAADKPETVTIHHATSELIVKNVQNKRQTWCIFFKSFIPMESASTDRKNPIWWPKILNYLQLLLYETWDEKIRLLGKQ